MSAIRIIPCIDFKDGRVVKGVKFTSLRDAGDPLEIAKVYSDSGADELFFLDISATGENRISETDLIGRIKREITIPLTVGGGVGSLDDIGRLLDAGADRVSIGSALIKTPDLLNKAAATYSSKNLVASIDVKRNASGAYEVLSGGGRIFTGLKAEDWALELAQRGAGEILLTSFDRDGTKSGYDLEITGRLADLTGLPIIASGGAGSMQDFYDGALVGKASGLLAASLFHFGEVKIPDLKDYLRKKGLKVKDNE